ncbi:type I restriction endonuclease subunit R, partial [Vibrio breoganii]
YFSKLLKQAIQQAKEMFDAPVKQYLLFADFEEQVKERDVKGMPTDRFAELDPKIKRHVQAFYGLFPHHLGDHVLSEDECFNYALQIDEIVTAAVAEFSINPQEIENQIRRK